MFSGIVAAMGRITELTPRNDGTPTVRLTVEAGSLGLDDIGLGDSIACGGVCLTVETRGNCFYVDVSPETLSHGRAVRARADQPEKSIALGRLKNLSHGERHLMSQVFQSAWAAAKATPWPWWTICPKA